MLRLAALMFFLLFSSLPAQAHELGSSGGFITGFNHPVLGFDHLLAMLCVGVLSTQLGGRAIWSVPGVFVMFMLLGGILGLFSVPLPFVEMGIALSVLLLGVALAIDKRLPQLLIMAFVGVFAIFHGHAHGVEMPQLANPVLYALGFICGTATIHLVGVVLGMGMQHVGKQYNLMRMSGGVIALIGGYLLIGS
ncbi:HupE/UreJ family protein [uncultured Shewanella sp.]|uniref:HupE/UreJ family protein n=1 Tax=Shewanella atlantica TaxID=271099 RepID=UPI0026285BE5|nr:HupE/UreJ family protein [uncultured Shewanella sp.]